MAFQYREKLLWEAATEGNLADVQALAGDDKVDVNWGDFEYRRTPFYRACGHGRVSVVEYLLRHPRINPAQPMNEAATPFFIACQQGCLDVIRLLLEDPRIDPCAARRDGVTPFYTACQSGHRDLVAALLADPRIDPGYSSPEGTTPFFVGCQEGHREVVALLLADPRVDCEARNSRGFPPFCIATQNDHRDLVLLLLDDPALNPNVMSSDLGTPLYFASQNGCLSAAKCLLASDRVIDTTTRCFWNNKKPAEHARWAATQPRWPNFPGEDYEKRRANCPLIAELIEEYEQDPAAVRTRLREEPGLREHYIGHTFALVVFHADGFVRLAGGGSQSQVAGSENARRFFTVTSRLPLELQMIVCSRLFGSPREIVPSRDSEWGFRWLAMRDLKGWRQHWP